MDIHGKIIRSNPLFMETIIWYTSYGYKDFNTRMRKGVELTQTQKDHLNVLDQIFKLIDPLENSITVYKGIADDKYDSDKSFVSTSRKESATYEFTSGNCCVIEFNVSAGSKVLFLENTSEFKNEREILLNRDGKIFITGSQKMYPKTKIFATYIPECSIGIHKVETAKEAVDLKSISERIKSYFLPDDFDFNDKSDFETSIRDYYIRLTNETPSPEIVDLIYSKIIN